MRSIRTQVWLSVLFSSVAGCATPAADGSEGSGMLPGAGFGGSGLGTGGAGVPGAAGASGTGVPALGAGSGGAGGTGVGVAAGAGGSLGMAGGAAIAGSGGAAGTGIDGMAGSAGTSVSGAGGVGGVAGGSASGPPCMTDAKQVIVLGDSYVYWGTHNFPGDLATAAGNGAVGVWDTANTLGGRLYAVGGFSMASGGIGLIPPQLDSAIADDPDIHAIVMTGGGNDILIPDASLIGSDQCKESTQDPPAEVCQQIVHMATDAAKAMMDKAAAAGIQDTIYFFYPNVPDGTLLGGAHPNVILDWAYPLAQETCEGAEMRTGGKMRCHFIDTRPIFMGHPEYFAAGDVHESPAGSKAIADAVVKVMKDNCIAQPASSGCCTP